MSMPEIWFHLMASVEAVTHVPSFFKDRYFPTSAEDIIAADKVLVEYRDGDEEMAPFVNRSSYHLASQSFALSTALC